MESLFNILLFGGLFFLMMRFGCGSHMLGHGKDNDKKAQAGGQGGGCCGGEKKEAAIVDRGSREGPPKSDADPVCGQIVSTDTAKTSLHDGLVYFFCSAKCREAFEASPGKYAEQDEATTPPLLEQGAAKDSGHA